MVDQMVLDFDSWVMEGFKLDDLVYDFILVYIADSI